MADDEAQVRSWLRSVEAPPSGVEVDDLVRLGRSRVRQRRLLAGGATVAAALAVAVAVPAATQVWAPTGTTPAGPPEHLPVVQCTLDAGFDQKLREVVAALVDRSGGQVTAMDPTGRYILGHYDADTGWIFQDGASTDLVAPADYDIVGLTAVNRHGDVVGTVIDAANNHAVALWPAADRDQPRVLAPPDTEAQAAGITDDGTVFANRLGPYPGAYRWDASGAGQPLPVPEGAEHAWVNSANGRYATGLAVVKINRHSVEPIPQDSVIADLAEPAELFSPGNAQISVPVRWDLDAGTVEVIDPLDLVRYGVSSEAEAVTAGGDIVTVMGETRSWYDGELAILSMPGTPGRVNAAETTEGATMIAGSASGEHNPVVWRC